MHIRSRRLDSSTLSTICIHADSKDNRPLIPQEASFKHVLTDSNRPRSSKRSLGLTLRDFNVLECLNLREQIMWMKATYNIINTTTTFVPWQWHDDIHNMKHGYTDTSRHSNLIRSDSGGCDPLGLYVLASHAFNSKLLNIEGSHPNRSHQAMIVCCYAVIARMCSTTCLRLKEALTALDATAEPGHKRELVGVEAVDIPRVPSSVLGCRDLETSCQLSKTGHRSVRLASP